MSIIPYTLFSFTHSGSQKSVDFIWLYEYIETVGGNMSGIVIVQYDNRTNFKEAQGPMKNKIQFLILSGLIGLLMIVVSGCYTQLGMTRGERHDDREYTAIQQDEDTSYVANEDQDEYRNQSEYYNSDYDEYGQSYRPRVGFSYYYPSSYWPSTAFSVAYANPWAYDCYSAYDPWICGTPYVTYPYYGYGYFPSAYYYPPYYYHYNYSYLVKPVRHERRDFGQTRGSAGRGAVETRGDVPTSVGTGYDLPRGARVSSPMSGPSSLRSVPVVKDNSRRTGSSRGAYVPRSDGRSGSRSNNNGVRGTSSRGGNSRGDVRREQTAPRYRTPEAPAIPPTYRAPSNDNGSSRGEQSHGTRDAGSPRSSSPSSYTPPPQHNSSPPAPSSGSAPSSGTSRSGRRP